MGENTTNTCRMCLCGIIETEQFYFLNNDNELKLQFKLLNFLPEIDLNMTPNPITCNRCMTMIEQIYEFKQMCLQTEVTIRNSRQVPFDDVLTYVKYETIEEEMVENNIKVELSDFQFMKEDCLEINTDVPISIEEPFKTEMYYCHNCDFNTNEKINLIQHVKLHNVRSFQCNVCNYCFVNRFLLEEHVQTHIAEKPYKCTECDYSFARKRTLKRHQLRHSNKKLYQCHHCDYSTNRKDSLVRHIMTHPDINLFVCNFCNYSTQTRTLFKTHMQIHKPVKMYKCDQCDFQSSYKSSLTNHIVIHSAAKPFVCGTCRFSTRHQADLNKHMISHSSAKPFVCKTCGFSTRRQYNLKNHMKIHNLVKPFACKTCGYSTRYHWYLKKHMMIHT